jgi:hypothetical protein
MRPAALAILQAHLLLEDMAHLRLHIKDLMAGLLGCLQILVAVEGVLAVLELT